MKRVFTLVVLLIALVMTGTSQTTIPNSNFEQWTGNQPDNWDATNINFGIMNIVSVFRDTVMPLQGSACVRIESDFHNLGIATPLIPGIITLGEINIDFTTFAGSIEGGIPFTGRPVALKGFIDAAPASGDSAMIAIGFSKWNGTSRDTIGDGIKFFSTVHNEWVAFTIPITFYTGETPDSMNIIISSSAVGMDVTVPGSKVRIDSLLFDYGGIMVEIPGKDQDLHIWADAERRLYVSGHDAGELSGELQVFDMQGKLVHQTRLSHCFGQCHTSLAGLKSGVYIVRVKTDHQAVQSVKIVLL